MHCNMKDKDMTEKSNFFRDLLQKLPQDMHLDILYFFKCSLMGEDTSEARENLISRMEERHGKDGVKSLYKAFQEIPFVQDGDRR